MAGVANTALLDLIATTQKALPWDGKFEVLQKYQNYEVINRWFARDRVEEGSGTSIQENVSVTESGAAAQVRLYEGTEVHVADVQQKIDVPWTQHQTYYSIERREMLRNRKPAGLIKLIKVRRIDGMMDSANLLEGLAWRPPATTTDDLNPYGIPYWLPPYTSSDTAAGDFKGGHPYAVDGNQYSSCAGISCTTYTRHKSYNALDDSSDGSVTATYITRLSSMYRKLRFVAPVTVRDLNTAPYSNLRLYTGNTKIGALEERARKSNDQIGADLARYQGSTLFNGVPIVYVAYLDTYDTATTYTGAYPLYFINHNFFKAFVLEGDYFRENEPMNSVEKHNVFTTFVDLSYNFIVTNRRQCGGVISYVA